MQKIEAPTNCPSCESTLEWENHLLYCRNTLCPAQSSKKLEHFAKSAKVKGLGPSSLKKLGVTSLVELYSLSREEIVELLNSEAIGNKIYNELENSKSAPLEVLLPAFSIKLVGKSASEKLASVCTTVLTINEETCRRAGLGDKTTHNLMEWLRNEYPMLSSLPFTWKFTDRGPALDPEQVKGNVCISGRLKTYKTKAEATNALLEKGYCVQSSVTKSTHILVNESGIESSKTKKAREMGIEIVDNLKDLIGEN